MNNKAYIPFVLGVAAAIGLWLGSGMQDPFRITAADEGMNKIEQILQYVENDYVDTISRAKLEDEIIAYLLQRLDPHSYYISEDELALVNEPLEGNFEGVGIQFNLRDDSIYVVSVIEGGPSKKAGILPGDIIVQVDSHLVAGTGLTNTRVMSLLKGVSGTTVKVGVKRPGKDDLVFTNITRGEVPISSFDAAYLLNDSTIYIRLARFAKTTHEEFKERVYPLKTPSITGVVLDLRGNGGGILHAAVQVLDEFLVRNQLITYTEGKSRPRREYRSTSDGKFKDVAISVIIDGLSASASEIIAGAVQDLGRGSVVGQRSFGKGLVQEQSEWEDGSATRLTVARYFTPNGRSIQRPYASEMHINTMNDTLKGGIVPDVKVDMDTVGVTWLFAELVHSGKLTRYAYAYRDRELQTLIPMSPDEFVRDVKLEDLSSALRAYLEADQETIVEKEWRNSEARMALRMKAIIGRSLFGEEMYFRILNTEDTFVRSAVDALSPLRKSEA